MARNVFISFRFDDGNEYKQELSKCFDRCDDTIDCSENEDRSGMSEEVIKKYLYDKLKRSSVTIVLLTPEAIEHQKINGKYDDWMYDEIRYSLENREGNRPNGLIAVYVSESKSNVINEHKCFNSCEKECDLSSIYSFDNLCRYNMLNVKEKYKKHKCNNVFDSDYDSYCSLISFDEFKNNIDKYIEIAIEKREMLENYKLTVDLNKTQ